MSKGFQQRAVEQVAEPGAFTGELIAGRVVGWKVPLNWEDRSCDRPIRPERRSTFQVMKRSRLYPRPAVASGAVSAVGQAGGAGRWPRIRRCRGRSRPWPPTPWLSSPRSTPRGLRRGRGCGTSGHRPRCHAGHRALNWRRPRRSSAGSGFTRCVRSSTTARRVLGRWSRCSFGPATPVPCDTRSHMFSGRTVRRWTDEVLGASRVSVR